MSSLVTIVALGFFRYHAEEQTHRQTVVKTPSPRLQSAGVKTHDVNNLEVHARYGEPACQNYVVLAG